MYCLQVIGITSAQQRSVKHETTGPYALPNDETADKNKDPKVRTYVSTYVFIAII